MECKNCSFWTGKNCTDLSKFVDKFGDDMCRYNPNAVKFAGDTPQNSVRRNLEFLPWEKEGQDGWDNYANFEDWLSEQLGEEHDEWVQEAPTKLITIMAELAGR